MHKIFRFLAAFETSLAYGLVVALTVLLSVQILNRYVFHTSFFWMEEIIRISFVWLIYFCVASAARQNAHIRVGIIDLVAPPSVVRIVDRIADALVIVFSLAIVWLGILLVQASIRFGDRSPVTEIPMALIYAVIPFCFALIAFRTAQVIWRGARGRARPPVELPVE